jgi:hypothetical protein
MNLDLVNESIPLIILAGALGAFVADILKDNCIILPKKFGEVLNLGFLGSLTLGAIAGYVIDGSFLTAFMGGFMGKEVITNLVSRKSIFKNDSDDLSGGSPA